MKVQVDPEKCQGHTLCSIRAGELFELSDVDGHATAIADEVPSDLEDDALDAVASCPEQAISVL